MAPPNGKRGGAGLVVDIDLDAPKRPRGRPGAAGDDPLGDVEADGDADDVRGELIAKRVLRALDTGNAAELNTALKDHYEHCKGGDEPDDLGPPSDAGAGLGAAGFGGPRSEY